ncbi:MAG: hypothetical protein AB1746_06885, partial [Candidatus Zixiibacteriota bacterium]
GLTLTPGAASGYVMTSDENGNGTWQMPSGGGCWLCPNNYTYLADIDDSVGIGTDTPVAKLTVNGKTRIYTDEVDVWGHANKGLVIGKEGSDEYGRSAADSGSIFFPAHLDDYCLIYSRTNDGETDLILKVQDDPTDNILLMPYGQVGIGIEEPNNKLHVYGSGKSFGGIPGFNEVTSVFERVNSEMGHSAISISARSGFDPILYLAGEGLGYWDIRYDATEDFDFQIRDHAAGANNIDVTIDTAGRVGINEDDPGYRLHVFDDDTITCYIGSSNNASLNTHILHTEYTGGVAAQDIKAIYGKAIVDDAWGYGGYFAGGYTGVLGRVDPTGSDYYLGVRGYVDSGNGENVGVRGDGRNSTYSNTGVAGYGYADSAESNTGVFGWADNPQSNGWAIGVEGDAPVAPNQYAGFFLGNVFVNDTLQAYHINTVTKTVKIDHPLDPENKYLQLSEVESPEMKTVYDGVAVINDDGEAIVELPAYFEALNIDYRYQLTCIGGYAPVYIAEEVKDNRFVIAGGKAGMKISWQVTGIRNDASAIANRIQVEVDKLPAEKGKYLDPVAFGLEKSNGVINRPHRELPDRNSERRVR